MSDLGTLFSNKQKRINLQKMSDLYQWSDKMQDCIDTKLHSEVYTQCKNSRGLCTQSKLASLLVVCLHKVGQQLLHRKWT